LVTGRHISACLGGARARGSARPEFIIAPSHFVPAGEFPLGMNFLAAPEKKITSPQLPQRSGRDHGPAGSCRRLTAGGRRRAVWFANLKQGYSPTVWVQAAFCQAKVGQEFS